LRLTMRNSSSVSAPATTRIPPPSASDGMLQNQKLPVQNCPDYRESKLFC
jgi:hypothetical protein